MGIPKLLLIYRCWHFHGFHYFRGTAQRSSSLKCPRVAPKTTVVKLTHSQVIAYNGETANLSHNSQFTRNNLFHIKVFKISRMFIGKFQDSNSKQILVINSLALLKILGKLDCYLLLIKLWLMYWKI